MRKPSRKPPQGINPMPCAMYYVFKTIQRCGTELLIEPGMSHSNRAAQQAAGSTQVPQRGPLVGARWRPVARHGAGMQRRRPVQTPHGEGAEIRPASLPELKTFDGTCMKDPGAFWGLSSALLPEK
jgi:hypothetical protein